MDLLQELGSQRKILLKNHFQIDPVNLGMLVNESNSGNEAPPDAFEKIGFRGVLLDLAKRKPHKFDGMIEHDMKEPFLGPEILKNGTLGNSQFLNHPVDTGLAKPLAGELLHGGFQDPLLLVIFKVLESLPWKHESPLFSIMTTRSLYGKSSRCQ